MKKLTVLFALLSLTLSLYTHAQFITTVAGTGEAGSYGQGDGQPASAAKLRSPHALTSDHWGNLYFSDGNHSVRKIDTLGMISTVAGSGMQGFSGDGGLATAAKLYTPGGLAIDNSGNLYIADMMNLVIRKVDVVGIITTIAGNHTAGSSGDGGPATNAQLWPSNLAIDTSGNLYVTDAHAHVIRRISTSGMISTYAGTGTPGYSGDNIPASTAQLNYPAMITFDRFNNLYIADQGNHRIRKVDNTQTISTVAGNGIYGFNGDGGPATAASLGYPATLATDNTGNVIFSNDGPRIRKITATGTLLTIAGSDLAGFSGDGGDPLNAAFDGIGGLCYGKKDYLYLADGNRIRQIRYDTSVAGSHNGIVILPNPVIPGGKLHIRGVENERVRAELVNCRGQILLEYRDVWGQLTIPLELSAGTYILKIATPQKQAALKLIIQ